MTAESDTRFQFHNSKSSKGFTASDSGLGTVIRLSFIGTKADALLRKKNTQIWKKGRGIGKWKKNVLPYQLPTKIHIRPAATGGFKSPFSLLKLSNLEAFSLFSLWICCGLHPVFLYSSVKPTRKWPLIWFTSIPIFIIKSTKSFTAQIQALGSHTCEFFWTKLDALLREKSQIWEK